MVRQIHHQREQGYQERQSRLGLCLSKSEASDSNYDGQDKRPWAMIAPEDASKTTPKGALSRRPHGMFFSTPITIPSTSIHPIFPAPTTNIRSINDQQQPRQKIPWSTPRRS